LTAERWRQIKAIVAEALAEESTTARVILVAQRCGEDLDLRREVESLVDQTTSALENFAQKASTPLRRDRTPLQAGERIGAYAIVRELGRGGMGAVYLAERADGAFEKQVAIKVLKRGTDTDEILRRFQAERQILARLNHPNITRLIDAGETEDGLPYVVMDYVAGKPINQYAAEQQLSVTGRLKLFRSMCGAVSYAHQNLVIHRDLKPSNILVTENGEVQLLDFGIAKLLSNAEADGADATVTMLRVMTPEYASPEQIKGEPITTLSDVYSLGVCLYELLAGQRPYKLKRKSPDEISKAICEQEPERPSTTVAKDGGNPKNQVPSSKLLRGDLDNIVLMALRKEPARRYASVEQFSEDIRRHLEGLPVRARKGTFSYRTSKFIERHKVGTAAALLIVLTLSAGIVATAVQARRANRRFNEVRKIANSLLFEFHNSIKDLPGSLAARQLVTRRAQEYLDSLAQEAGNDLSLRSELATAYEKLGVITFDVQQAIDSHRKAVVLNEALVEAAPKNTAYRKQLAESYGDLSDVLKIAGNSTQSIDYAKKSLAIMQPLAAENPLRNDLQAALADRYLSAGIVMSDAGDFHGALETNLKALEIQRKVVAHNPSDKEELRDLVHIYGVLGDATEDMGDYPTAFEYCRKEMDIARSIFQSDRSNARYRRDMWAAYFRTGRQLALTGDAKGAFENYSKATELMESLSVADPDDRGHRRWLAVTYSSVADLLAATNEPDQALKLYGKAITMSEELLAADAGRFETRKDLAQMYQSAGRLLGKTGQASRAVEDFNQAKSLAEASFNHDPQNARVRGRLAGICADLADLYRKVAEQRDPPSAVNRKANLQTARGLYERSLNIYQDLKSKGTLSAADDSKPDEIAREIAKCDAALK
jgi:serine/threonine protein kinase